MRLTWPELKGYTRKAGWLRGLNALEALRVTFALQQAYQEIARHKVWAGSWNRFGDDRLYSVLPKGFPEPVDTSGNPG